MSTILSQLLSQNAEELPSKSPLAEGTLKRRHKSNACFSGCLPMEVLPGNATAPEVAENGGLQEATIYSIFEDASPCRPFWANCEAKMQKNCGANLLWQRAHLKEGINQMHALVAACQWRSCPVTQLHRKSLWMVVWRKLLFIQSQMKHIRWDNPFGVRFKAFCHFIPFIKAASSRSKV